VFKDLEGKNLDVSLSCISKSEIVDKKVVLLKLSVLRTPVKTLDYLAQKIYQEMRQFF